MWSVMTVVLSFTSRTSLSVAETARRDVAGKSIWKNQAFIAGKTVCLTILQLGSCIIVAWYMMEIPDILY